MLDERLLKITIDRSGEKHVFEKLAMTAIGTKHTSTIQNYAEIRIANMDKDVRDQLLTQGTPYALKKPPVNSILIEAGRESTGLSTVYQGDITTVDLTEPPDIWLVMQAITGLRLQHQTTALSGDAFSPFSLIAQQIADEMELPLVFQAEEVNIANFSFSGSVQGLLNRLGTISIGVDAFVDNDVLVVKPRDFTGTSPVTPVNINTGMISIPKFIDVGARCTVLVNKDIKLGDDIDLSSTQYPAVNGLYQVYKLGFNLANRDTPFYYDIEATRKGRTGIR